MEITAALQSLTQLLVRQGMMIATAESCTGGLLAGYLTEQAGSSKWFERGFVTYSNLAKQQMLAVPAALIANYGAVSTEVAEAMAAGALKNSDAHIAVSITGIAGPDGGSKEKPVGTVCFGYADKTGVLHSERYCFADLSREQVRQQACLQAMRGIMTLL